MTWHYRIRSRRDPKTKEKYYEIVEVYNRPFGVTENAITPFGNSRDELIRVLEMMLHDAKKYRTLVEK